MTIISGFGQTPHVIMLTDKLKDSERRVWGYINMCRMQKEYSWPKPETIAGDLNLNKKVVERGIGKLVKLGLLAVEKNAKGTIYQLLDIPTSFSGSAEVIKLPRKERQEQQPATQQEREERQQQEQRPAAEPNHLDYPAVKVYKDETSFFPKADNGLRAAIVETVKEYEKWRSFLKDCIRRGYGAYKLQSAGLVEEYKAWVIKKDQLAAAEEWRARRRHEEAAEWMARWDEPDERIKQQDAPPREEAKPQRRAMLPKSETPDSAKSGASTASQSG